jgi:hypothetical protein
MAHLRQLVHVTDAGKQGRVAQQLPEDTARGPLVGCHIRRCAAIQQLWRSVPPAEQRRKVLSHHLGNVSIPCTCFPAVAH